MKIRGLHGPSGPCPGGGLPTVGSPEYKEDAIQPKTPRGQELLLSGKGEFAVNVARRLLFLVAASALAGSALLPAAELGKVGLQVSKDHVDFLAGKDLIGRYHIG